MRTERKLLKGTLLALCAALLMLYIVLAAGWSKPKKPMPHCRRYGNQTGSGRQVSPQTGDNSSLALWFAVLFVSGGVLAVLCVANKKKSKNALK